MLLFERDDPSSPSFSERPRHCCPVAYVKFIANRLCAALPPMMPLQPRMPTTPVAAGGTPLTNVQSVVLRHKRFDVVLPPRSYHQQPTLRSHMPVDAAAARQSAANAAALSLSTLSDDVSCTPGVVVLPRMPPLEVVRPHQIWRQPIVRPPLPPPCRPIDRLYQSAVYFPPPPPSTTARTSTCFPVPYLNVRPDAPATSAFCGVPRALTNIPLRSPPPPRGGVSFQGPPLPPLQHLSSLPIPVPTPRRDFIDWDGYQRQQHAYQHQQRPVTVSPCSQNQLMPLLTRHCRLTEQVFRQIETSLNSVVKELSLATSSLRTYVPSASLCRVCELLKLASSEENLVRQQHRVEYISAYSDLVGRTDLGGLACGVNANFVLESTRAVSMCSAGVDASTRALHAGMLSMTRCASAHEAESSHAALLLHVTELRRYLHLFRGTLEAYELHVFGRLPPMTMTGPGRATVCSDDLSMPADAETGRTSTLPAGCQWQRQQVDEPVRSDDVLQRAFSDDVDQLLSDQHRHQHQHAVIRDSSTCPSLLVSTSSIIDELSHLTTRLIASHCSNRMHPNPAQRSTTANLLMHHTEQPQQTKSNLSPSYRPAVFVSTSSVVDQLSDFTRLHDIEGVTDCSRMQHPDPVECSLTTNIAHRTEPAQTSSTLSTYRPVFVSTSSVVDHLSNFTDLPDAGSSDGSRMLPDAAVCAAANSSADTVVRTEPTVTSPTCQPVRVVSTSSSSVVDELPNLASLLDTNDGTTSCRRPKYDDSTCTSTVVSQESEPVLQVTSMRAADVWPAESPAEVKFSHVLQCTQADLGWVTPDHDDADVVLQTSSDDDRKPAVTAHSIDPGQIIQIASAVELMSLGGFRLFVPFLLPADRQPDESIAAVSSDVGECKIVVKQEQPDVIASLFLEGPDQTLEGPAAVGASVSAFDLIKAAAAVVDAGDKSGPICRVENVFSISPDDVFVAAAETSSLLASQLPESVDAENQAVQHETANVESTSSQRHEYGVPASVASTTTSPFKDVGSTDARSKRQQKSPKLTTSEISEIIRKRKTADSTEDVRRKKARQVVGRTSISAKRPIASAKSLSTTWVCQKKLIIPPPLGALPAAAKRGRGRPRKHPIDTPILPSPAAPPTPDKCRRRGRPPKHRIDTVAMPSPAELRHIPAARRKILALYRNATFTPLDGTKRNNSALPSHFQPKKQLGSGQGQGHAEHGSSASGVHAESTKMTTAKCSKSVWPSTSSAAGDRTNALLKKFSGKNHDAEAKHCLPTLPRNDASRPGHVDRSAQDFALKSGVITESAATAESDARCSTPTVQSLMDFEYSNDDDFDADEDDDDYKGRLVIDLDRRAPSRSTSEQSTLNDDTVRLQTTKSTPSTVDGNLVTETCSTDKDCSQTTKNSASTNIGHLPQDALSYQSPPEPESCVDSESAFGDHVMSTSSDPSFACTGTSTSNKCVGSGSMLGEDENNNNNYDYVTCSAGIRLFSPLIEAVCYKLMKHNYS